MLSRRDIVAAASLYGALRMPPLRAQPATRTGLHLMRASAGAAFLDRPKETGSPLLGYQGVVPGPVLRLKRGEELAVRLVNDLAEPTSLHWYGVRLPNAMDGVPDLTQAPVARGESFDYRFRPPDAGTFWYRAHASEQAARGLYGALIVDEPEPVDADRDIVLVLGLHREAGGHSSSILVNGSLRPTISVGTGDRLRLRLINATSRHGLSLRLEQHPAWVTAIDGQPTEPFVARDGRLGLGPGNRLDVFVDVMNGGASLLAGLRDEVPIARLIDEAGTRKPGAPRSQPRPLPSNPLPARIDLKNALRAELTLAGATPFSPNNPPLLTVKRGRPVVVTIHNSSGQPHAVHLHGHHFRLLDRLDDGWKPYWLDTLIVGQLVERIAFVADNPGKWLIDCRMLDRDDVRTATWLNVV